MNCVHFPGFIFGAMSGQVARLCMSIKKNQTCLSLETFRSFNQTFELLSFNMAHAYTYLYYMYLFYHIGVLQPYHSVCVQCTLTHNVNPFAKQFFSCLLHLGGIWMIEYEIGQPESILLLLNPVWYKTYISRLGKVTVFLWLDQKHWPSIYCALLPA